jgi:hypothetical protein
LDCLIKSLDGYKEKVGVPSGDETNDEANNEPNNEPNKINIHVQ